MSFLFTEFAGWKEYTNNKNISLVQSVLNYEKDQRDISESKVISKLMEAFSVMKDAVKTGLTEDTTSR